MKQGDALSALLFTIFQDEAVKKLNKIGTANKIMLQIIALVIISRDSKELEEKIHALKKGKKRRKKK